MSSGDGSSETILGWSCNSCQGPDSGGMVQCDDCDKWHHFTCVGVTEEVENQSWICPKCVSAKWVQQEDSTSSKNLQSEDATHRANSQKSKNPSIPENEAQNGPNSVTSWKQPTNKPFGTEQLPSKASSVVKSTSSKRSSRTVLKLQMEKLEEELRLEREFLDKKYALLEEMASDESFVSISSASSSMSRVHDWVKNTNHEKEVGSGCPVPFETQRNSTRFQQSLAPEHLAAHIDRLAISRPYSADEETIRHLPPAVSSITSRRSAELLSNSPMRKADFANPGYCRQQPPVFLPHATENCTVSPRAHTAVQRPAGYSHHAEGLVDRSLQMQTSGFANPGYCRQQPSVFLPHAHATENCTVPPRKEPIAVQLPAGYSHHVEGLADCPLTTQQIAARQAIPKDLPPFSGKSEEWPIFYSMFTNTTAMCGFTDAENTTRLQKCLTGKAYDAAKSLLMHPSNVTRVIATLRMRFGQPEAIVHSLVEKINALPVLREDKLETIMDFAVEVQNFCSVVDACGLEEHMYNVSLLHQLVNKLPPTIKLDWARYRQMFSKVNLATFGNWIYSLAEAASTVTIPGIQEPKPIRNEPRQSKKGSGFLNAHLESEATNSHEASRTQKNIKASCPVCEACCDSVDKCKQFRELSRDSRWAVVREFGLCRRCLRRHNGSCEAKVCGKDGCTSKHHELLHNEKKNKTETLPETHEPQPGPSSSLHDCNTHRSRSSAVLFRYLPVTIHGKNGAIQAFAFLDEGSGLTLVDQDLADELGLEGVKSPLCLRWTGGTERREEESRITQLSIMGTQDGAKRFKLDEVRTVKELQLPQQSLDMGKMKERYPYLRGLPIASYEDARPRILIGLKHAHVSLVLQSREGQFDQPIAIKTRLGWTVCGGSCEDNAPNLVHYSFHVGSQEEQTDEKLHEAMKEYFALDSLGVVKPSHALLSSEDQRSCRMLESSTTFNGERYVTGLLWRYDDIRLPDSRPMALRRYRHLQSRMRKDPELAKALNQKIMDYLAKGYVRKLTKEEEAQPVKRAWYLPVFPVFNPNKPGKVRIVWDAAATMFGVSLNSALLKGPDQMCALLSILLQFREYRVGLTGDIREMFHQVEILEQDRPCQRFFWEDESGEISVYEMCVMTFGACCSPSSAQYVKNVNAERFAGKYPRAVQAIIKQHYVDDMLVSVESEEEAVQLALEVKHVHSQGGFEIRNWISNSSTVLAALGEGEASLKSLDLSAELSTEKVLGLWWCTETDTLTYKVGWTRYDKALLEGLRRPTKREVLRVLMSIFDPLGLIAHFLIYLKILLQEIWRSGVQWDDEIDDTLYAKWQSWLRVLPEVENVQIPRCYHVQALSNGETELHTFVDASENGFAAVSFLRFIGGDQVKCILIAAKTRVAPLKFLSIPRLELQAAVLGARLAQSITESLSIHISKRRFWTDSRDVLCWINSDHRRFTQFVAHRVSEILDETEASSWLWVPTKMNVADDATKWETRPDLSIESRWFKGPKFLWQNEAEWPEQPSWNTSTSEELRANLVGHL